MENNFPPVFGKAGLHGRLSSGPLNENEPDQTVLIELADGRKVQAPARILVRQPDGGYYLPLSPADVETAGAASARPAAEQASTLIVPVIQEEMAVEKRMVDRGTVRINKLVREHEEIVDEPLLKQEVAIEHVPINKLWDGPPPAVRYEGEILVLPLLEEVMVVEKRLMLKEELRISRVQRTAHEPQKVVLRSEEVNVERVSPDSISQRDTARS